MQSAILLSFVASSSLPPCGLQSTHPPMPCYVSLYVVYNVYRCDWLKMGYIQTIFGPQTTVYPSGIIALYKLKKRKHDICFGKMLNLLFLFLNILKCENYCKIIVIVKSCIYLWGMDL